MLSIGPFIKKYLVQAPFIIFFSLFWSNAFAQTVEDESMSFSLYRVDYRPQFDLVQQIFASGTITSGTTEKFKKFIADSDIIPGGTVYLNSPGGSLVEGMELGKAIRGLGLNTNIGKRGTPQKPKDFDPEIESVMRKAFGDIDAPEILDGVCLSSCSLAYLGGVHRYFEKNSVYGVHRFSSDIPIQDPLDNAQIVSGIIVSYLKDMSIDPKLFSITTMAGKDDLVLLNQEELSEFNVITGSILKEEWELKSSPHGIYLLGTKEDERGVSKLMFACAREDNVLASIAFIPTSDEKGAQLILDNSIKAGYFIDNKIKNLEPSNKLKKFRKFNEVQAQWLVFPEDIQAISSANKYTGFALLPDMDGMFYGVTIGFGEKGKELIKNYAKDCWR